MQCDFVNQLYNSLHDSYYSVAGIRVMAVLQCIMFLLSVIYLIVKLLKKFSCRYGTIIIIER